MTDKLLHKSDFEPYVNQTFIIHSEELGDQEVEMVELTEKNYPGQESFSMLFKGPKEPIIQQMTYEITHEKMGKVRLFVVPINYHKQDGMYYQSVINRLLDSN
jgi:Domain of unknown function (DUF6916)